MNIEKINKIIEKKAAISKEEQLLKESIESKKRILYLRIDILDAEYILAVVNLIDEVQERVFFDPEVLKLVNKYPYDNGKNSTMVEDAMKDVLSKLSLSEVSLTWVSYLSNGKYGEDRVNVRIPTLCDPYNEVESKVFTQVEVENISKFYSRMKKAFYEAFTVEERLTNLGDTLEFRIPFFSNEDDDWLYIEGNSENDEWTIVNYLGNKNWAFVNEVEVSLEDCIFSIFLKSTVKEFKE